MPYQYVQERQDATDLASGRVLHGLPGRPALPVRLADEVFQRCLAARQPVARGARLVLYDPCCGAGYHLTVLGLLHPSSLAAVIGSDVDARAVEVARQNLDLLTPTGLAARAATLAQRAVEFGKESHRAAVDSAERLGRGLERDLDGAMIRTDAFVADALVGQAALQRLGPASVDLVVTDVPYGWRSFWQSTPSQSVADDVDPIESLLAMLLPLLTPGAIVGVISDKTRKTQHESFKRVKQFTIGKRRVTLYTGL